MTMTTAMMRILEVGLLGLPGAGKSTIARMLEAKGAFIADADHAVSRAYESRIVRARIEAALGPGLFDAEGRPRRQLIAARIFSDTEARRQIERVLHPAVIAQLNDEIKSERARMATTGGIIVLDVPLLVESGMAGRCDAFIFIKASNQNRLARVRARGWDAAELARRDAAQASAAAKCAAAGDRPLWTIDSDSDLAATARELDAVWSEIRALAMRAES